MNKWPQIDNLTQNSGKNNVIKNLTSEILLSRFSINIARVWNATLSRLRFRPMPLCHEISRARSVELILWNRHYIVIGSITRQCGCIERRGYVLSVQAHRGCIQRRHVRIHRAGAASFVLVSQCAFQCIPVHFARRRTVCRPAPFVPELCPRYGAISANIHCEYNAAADSEASDIHFLKT